MQQENITFNDMPQMLAVMYANLNELGDKVDKLIPPKKSEEQQWFNVADLIEFLPTHPAEQTIYGWTSARKILHVGLTALGTMLFPPYQSAISAGGGESSASKIGWGDDDKYKRKYHSNSYFHRKGRR